MRAKMKKEVQGEEGEVLITLLASCAGRSGAGTDPRGSASHPILPLRYEDEINKRTAAENEFVVLKKVSPASETAKTGRPGTVTLPECSVGSPQQGPPKEWGEHNNTHAEASPKLTGNTGCTAVPVLWPFSRDRAVSAGRGLSVPDQGGAGGSRGAPAAAARVPQVHLR